MKNVEKIIEFSKKNSEDKQVKAYNAISRMEQSDRKITFYAVAKEAGVTTQFLYSHPELRTIIEKKRK